MPDSGPNAVSTRLLYGRHEGGHACADAISERADAPHQVHEAHAGADRQVYARHVNTGAMEEIAALFADSSSARIDPGVVGVTAHDFGEPDVIDVAPDRQTRVPGCSARWRWRARSGRTVPWCRWRVTRAVLSSDAPSVARSRTSTFDVKGRGGSSARRSSRRSLVAACRRVYRGATDTDASRSGRPSGRPQPRPPASYSNAKIQGATPVTIIEDDTVTTTLRAVTRFWGLRVGQGRNAVSVQPVSAHWRTSSTRRFCARPMSVSFVSFGFDSPKPTALKRPPSTPYFATSSFTTASARRSDSA